MNKRFAQYSVLSTQNPAVSAGAEGTDRIRSDCPFTAVAAFSFSARDRRRQAPLSRRTMISKRYGFFRLPCSTGTDEIRCLCPFPAAADYREPGTGNWLRREALYRSSRSDTIIIHYSLFILHLRAALHPRSGTAHDRARLSREVRETDTGSLCWFLFIKPGQTGSGLSVPPLPPLSTGY